MPRKFKPGESGNPLGHSRRKCLTDALRLAAHEEVMALDAKGKNPRKVKRLRLVAEALLNKAAEGDVAAAREVMDRLEGKVPNVNVEVPVKPLDEMNHDELVSAILGSQDNGGTEEDSALSRATPAGHA